MAKKFKEEAIKYADDVISGKQVASVEVINACKRFKEDLKREDLEYRSFDVDFCINFIQGFFVHKKGEDLEGNPLQGKPLMLSLGKSSLRPTSLVFTTRERTSEDTKKPSSKLEERTERLPSWLHWPLRYPSSKEKAVPRLTLLLPL